MNVIKVLDAATERGILLAVAESCTGGMLAAALTAVPGCSSVFERGFVTYSNAAKVEMLGVRQETLDAHGAVSEAVAAEMPVIGFYMQTAVGGIRLPASFWRRFAAIENVAAIKIAPFNRYATLDVVRGVIEAGAEDRVTLYTGNDDHIVADLLTPFTVLRDGAPVTVRIRGGLLGHWAVWTRAAVDLHARIRDAADATPATEWLALDAAVTAMNAAVFDVANDFAGCIAGVHEVLRRQGLLEGTWCLDPAEGMGPGQADALDRVIATWPELTDDAFVAANLGRWLAP